MFERLRFVPAGDSALIVEMADTIDVATNTQVLALANRLRAADLPGVRDIVPTFATVAIHFDPLRTDFEALEREIAQQASRPLLRNNGQRVPIRVPVAYGGSFGPDLAAVASFADLTEREAIALHSGAIYRVFMLGFLPGFAYMGSVDARIASPRRAVPRTSVPAGSVGIAGRQTGIYPIGSPGGWQIVGRTPMILFDLTREDPFLFHPGDSVQFFPIDHTAWERFAS